MNQYLNQGGEKLEIMSTFNLVKFIKIISQTIELKLL